MLDLKDPTKVLARARDFIIEPESYHENFSLFIPNVIFPIGCVVEMVCVGSIMAVATHPSVWRPFH